LTLKGSKDPALCVDHALKVVRPKDTAGGTGLQFGGYRQVVTDLLAKMEHDYVKILGL
jgi:hypothetical protein